jgi:Fe-S-cluster containining protein
LTANPCLTCGACCAHYRVSFYWAEADDATPNGVPAALTEQLTPFRRVMKGTNCPTPRCTALEGRVGESVSCSIYLRRPQVCRDIMPSYWDGVTPSDKCDNARAARGMALLRPEDWHDRKPDPNVPPLAA